MLGLSTSPLRMICLLVALFSTTLPAAGPAYFPSCRELLVRLAPRPQGKRAIAKLQVTLVAERDHGSAAAGPVRERYVRQAMAGKIVLAAEGAIFHYSSDFHYRLAAGYGIQNRKRALIYGLEAEGPYLLSGLLKIVQMLRPEATANLSEEQYEVAHRRILQSILMPILTYPSLRAAWRSFRATDPHRQPVYSAIDRFVDAIDAKKTVHTGEAIRPYDTGYEIGLKHVIVGLARTYAQSLKREGSPLPENFENLLEEAIRFPTGLEIDQLKLDWRNRTFESALGQILPRAAANPERPVVILVGAAHLPAMEAYLKERFSLVPQVEWVGD